MNEQVLSVGDIFKDTSSHKRYRVILINEDMIQASIRRVIFERLY